MTSKQKIIHFAILFLILALAISIRTVNIENAPPGIYPDEANNATNAIESNARGSYPWFYPDNQGREAFFINLIAFSFKFFGISTLTFKLPAILFGILAVLGTYLLTRELFFRRPHVALIAGYLVAGSFWAINFSRIAFRAGMLPFILTFTFFFLFRGMRTKSMLSYACAGVVFGLGLHTYIAFRVAPLILVILLLALILTHKQFLKNYWRPIALFLFCALLAASPMLITFWQHPEYLSSRSASISILSPDVNHGHLWQTFARTFGLSLAKYNFWGDQNWRHNYPPYPVLDPLTGLAFLIGFLSSVVKICQLLLRALRHGRNEESVQTLPVYALLVSWFFVMLIPEFMTAEGLPHALRAIGTLPVVHIFAALTFGAVLHKKRSWMTETFFTILLSLTLLLLLMIGIFNAVKYHVLWANNIATASAFHKNITDMAHALPAFPEEAAKYVIVGPMERLPVRMFNADTSHVFYLYREEVRSFQPASSRQLIFLLPHHDAEILASLRTRFPHLTNYYEVRMDRGSTFYVLR